MYLIFKDDHDHIPLPPAPYVGEFDPLRSESNEEFIARLKSMGKSNKFSSEIIFAIFYFGLSTDSMEKFNQLARRFTIHKDSATNMAKYTKPT